MSPLRPAPATDASALGASRDALPDFVVIGAEKAGTTSLHAYLGDHPDVFLPSAKEVRFFDLDANYARGVEWYRRFFAPGVRNGAQALGEASPGYLHFPAVPARMRAVLPDARLIALLRDPVERAYSHYWHRVRGGHERRAFADVVDDRLASETPNPVIDIGRYAEHLERFLAVYPRDRLLVIFTERLQHDRASVCRAVFAFLGVDVSWTPRNLDVIENPAALPRSRCVQRMLAMDTLLKRVLKQSLSAPSWQALRRRVRRLNYRRFVYPDMDRAVAARLRGHYREPDARLRDLIGGRLPWDSPSH